MAGNIYHSWNGTVLTIQTDSGASSMDLKGEMGVRGPQGPAGGAINDVSLIDKTLTIENFAADAKVVGDKLAVAVGSPVIDTKQGTIITTDEAANVRLQGLRFFGKTVQNGTPTPDAPVALKSLDGMNITLCGQNLLRDRSAGITNTKNGVVYTHEADRINIKGTSTKNTWETINYLFLPAGTYKLWQTRGGNVAKDDASFVALIYKTDNETTDYSANAADSTDTFTLTETRKIRFCIKVKKGATVDGYIQPQVRYVPAKFNGGFEPYDGKVLSTDRTLRGLEYKYTQQKTPTYTDTNGKQWYCDEVDFARGVYIQRVKAITLSVSNLAVKFIKINGTTYPYYSFSPDDVKNDFASSSMCNRAILSADSNYTLGEFSKVGGTNEFRFYGNPNGTAGEVANAYNGATFYYPIEPIETPLTEEELKAFATAYTRKGLTNIFNHVSSGEFAVEYVADAKTYIDNRIQTLTDAIISLGGNI